MNQKSINDFDIVLRLPKATVEKIDTVARISNLSRSSWLRNGLQLALNYAMEHHVPILLQPDVKAALNPTGESR
jgi:hypothetical protein